MKSPFVPMALAVLAGLGVVSGCLSTMAPNLTSDEFHADLLSSLGGDPKGEHARSECLVCHEPERMAARRLAAMRPAERKAEAVRMEHGDGAGLVAQWMIEDPRGCLSCHQPRPGIE